MRIPALCIGLALFFVSECAKGQPRDFIEFWKNVDSEFEDPDRSPLKPDDLASFEGVARFEYDSSFAVWAEVKRFSREKPFTFKTTGSNKQRYQKVAELHFEIDSVELKLSAYRNLDLMRNPAYANQLFIPFTDKSNGFGTYEGGRYLEFELPEADSTLVDFNFAYNPYCAYSDRYSCPIPPRENDLDVAVRAGAKSPK
jgi:hypothetical protein